MQISASFCMRAGERERVDAATGPRAVLGSQRPGIREDAELNISQPKHSDALRARDGSRSVLSGRRAAASETHWALSVLAWAAGEVLAAPVTVSGWPVRI